MMLKKNNLINKILIISLVFIQIFQLVACNISSKHVKVEYSKNENENLKYWEDSVEDNITTWDNGNIVTWDGIEEYSNWVSSQVIFDDISNDYPIVECKVFDYKSNGQYFDGDKVYSLVNDKFDVNSFVVNYAIGTGVIVICCVFTVATGGTPICCIITGARDGAIKMATKGAAFGAAMKAINLAIKQEGTIDEAFYKVLEGSAEGYKWGAMVGAVSGALNSKYCFTKDTLVLTNKGLLPISSIAIGDLVYSYDEIEKTFDYKNVTQIIENETHETIKLIINNNDEIESTATHPFYTSYGWKAASDLKVGDRVLNSNNQFSIIKDIKHTFYDEEEKIYNLCVNDYHSFMVGNSGLVAHNRCNINSEYSGKTYKLKDPELAKKYPDGVPFTKDGFPNFKKYAKETVKFEYPSVDTLKADSCLTGNYRHDEKLACKLLGIKDTPPGYTWHHCQDKMTMQLVPTDLHMAVRHTGGASLIRDLLSSLM